MGRSRQRKVRAPGSDKDQASTSKGPQANDSAKSQPDKSAPSKSPACNRKSRSRSRNPPKSVDKPKEDVAASGGDTSDPLPPTRLIGPTQSPRDPNLYRVIRLSNAFVEAKKPNKTEGRVKTGAKCKRASSDTDTPSSKRSRPAKKDPNCLDLRITEFNKKILHICEESSECPPETSGPTNYFAFICCGPPFLSINENLDIEGSADQPLLDPISGTVELENEVLLPPADPNGASASLPYLTPISIRVNEWNKADPAEDEDSLETANCCESLLNGLYNVSSVAVTFPWGPLYDPDDAPGISMLARQCVQGCDYTSPNPNMDEETTTFMIYTRPNDVEKNVTCLIKKFQMNRDCVTTRLAQSGAYIDSLQQKPWNLHGHGLFTDPKRIKLMTLLTKENHPIRKIGAGGLIDTKLTDISRSTIERALTEYIRNNCRPEYMTVGIEAPKPLTELEEIAVKNFNRIGNGTPRNQTSDTRIIAGASNPFDTNDFGKLYKVHPDPTDSGGSKNCSKSSLLLSFPLPPETWKNYRTKPLEYLSFLIGHRGEGGLYTYLHSRIWIRDMEAKCSKSPYHRNQFVTMFEIHLQLTEDGFEEIESVLKAIFSYLKFLKNRGPQKMIYKELQRLQAIKFHSMGHNLERLTVLRGAHHLSKALQSVVSRDILLAQNMMQEFNGPLLADLLDFFKPGRANIMIVSRQYPAEELDQEEPFLLTRYGVSDVPRAWMTAFEGVAVYPEFKLPTRNIFIPEDFCFLEDSNEKIMTEPEHVKGDDFHDLWHMQNSRYESRAACIIHVVSAQALLNLGNSTKMSLFAKMFKKTLMPILYPAVLAGLFYSVERTAYGILIKVEMNRDKIGLVIEIMGRTLLRFHQELTDDSFDIEKALFKELICSRLSKPRLLSDEIKKSLTLRNGWVSTESLAVLDDLTLSDFNTFVKAMQNDLYFLLLVLGNVSVAEAKELSNSCIESDYLYQRKVSNEIQKIRVMQWPPGERCVRVQGFDTSNSETCVATVFQIGLADSRNILCAKLIEPLLQNFFLKNSDFAKHRLYIMVHLTKTSNVLEMCLFTSFPVDHQSVTPASLDESIEDALDLFYSDILEKLKSKDLETMKSSILGSCQYESTWHSPSHEVTCLTRSVRSLNMRNNCGIGFQKDDCVNLNIEKLQNWFSDIFLDPESDRRCAQSAPRQKRKLSIVVLGHVQEEEKPKTADPVKKTPVVTSMPASKILKKVEKEKASACTPSTTCAILMSKYNKKVALRFDVPKSQSDPSCSKKKLDEGISEDIANYYITDIQKFKGSLYKYPAASPGN